MPASKAQEVITAGGKQFLWNRLPVTASVQLWCELSPVILPAVVEVIINTPLAFVDGKLVLRSFDMRELTGLPDALRKALKELPYQRQMAIAQLALRDTMLGQNSVAKDFDKHLDDISHFYELLFRALWLQYEGFIGVLGGLGVRLPGLTPSPSADSSTSVGQSSTS